MPKGIPGPNVTMNSGRRAVGAPIGIKGSVAMPGTTAHMSNNRASATSGRGLGTKPRSLGTSGMNQAQDSGGGTLNFEPANFQSNSLKAASGAPITGMIPNTVAAGAPINVPGGGKVDKRVAGIAKFYGR